MKFFNSLDISGQWLLKIKVCELIYRYTTSMRPSYMKAKTKAGVKFHKNAQESDVKHKPSYL